MSKVRHIVQAGLLFPIGRVALFGEMQLLNPFAQRQHLAVHFLAGANLSL